jgi:hypothetical protein
MEEHMLFADRVMDELHRQPGASDRQVSENLGCRVQQVNNECRHLANLGRIERKKIGDEPMGNFSVRRPSTFKIV